ncbi:uncharacterized protein EI90DRAFT_3072065 [Cantharellus anzutake]|uniref:uncharacterized protein n=1 Tax=Cantharellus anzutake TaxID=1750568 RepID=UPI0019052DFA|nr:uncharacterized protein EI90DRAFT_3072065 [Cantharellus anzutake]KAF8325867.1 hypothetical protein EI90DRAFT_3072065 [Cantharellus anzutake]
MAAAPALLPATSSHYQSASSLAQSSSPLSSANHITVPSDRASKYRGAVVEDLQLPPAFSLPHSERISKAIDLAYERDFSHIPVLSKERRPLGYIDVAQLKSKFESGVANPDDSVLSHMTKFKRNSRLGYTLITPDTPLEVLEEFLEKNLFALVTDYARKFVLAVATRDDLNNFVTRRGNAYS